jgi:hypothetical protein
LITNNFFKINRLWIILIPVLTVVLSSCRYSDYLTIDYTVFANPHNNQEGTQTAFLASKHAYRKPIGMSRFPDGGIPKYLIEDVSAYIYFSQRQTIKEIRSFSDLADLIGSYRSNWKTRTMLIDSVFYYYIEPVSGWQFYKDQLPERQEEINKLKKKYHKYSGVNIYTGELNAIDSSEFYKMYKQFHPSTKISLTEFNKKLKQVPLSQWGLNVQEIHPKSKTEYIKETIYLKNDCQMTRRAVIEQIISKLSVKQIRILMDKMEEYKNQLEGLKKQEYEIYSKETYQMLKNLVDSKHNGHSS